MVLLAKNKEISKDEEVEELILGPLAANVDGEENVDSQKKAATGTVNERLLAELQENMDKEKYGSRSSMGKKLGFGNRKTDEERKLSIARARDLNGVNPVVAITGSIFALLMAAGLWNWTNVLAEYFALHPVDSSSVYFVARVTAVFRNIVIGLISLASGFCGVTGVGIFLLGVRVAYGIAKGELDPTPVVAKQQNNDNTNEQLTARSTTTTNEEEEVVNWGSVWDLMTNKKRKRGQR